MRPNKLLGLAVVTLSALGTVHVVDMGDPTPVSARSDRSSAALEIRTGRVVVRYRSGASAQARNEANESAGGERRARVNRLNAEVVSVADVDQAVQAYSADPAVLWAEPEVRRARLIAEQTSTPERAEIRVAEALAANSAMTGSGVDVGVIDDGVFRGVADLPDARLVDGGDCSGDVCLATGGLIDAVGTGFGSHGTAVAAIIAGGANLTPVADGEGIVGVAPAARIHAYRVFDDPFLGSTSVAVANAMLAAAADQMDVVNMSLGGSFRSRLEEDALALARTASPNTVWVASAGNQGEERANFPAGLPGVVSVGASELSAGAWRLAAFSTRGDVDLLAPGRDVWTWWTDEVGRPTQLEQIAGTSFAAPQVAGVAAMLASVGIVGDKARAAVVAGAAPANAVTLDPPAPAAAMGLGRLDALKAYQLASGSAAYTAVFVDEGHYVAADVGRRTVEVLRVAGTGAGPVTVLGTGGVGTLTASSSAAAAAPNSATTYRTVASYVAPPSGTGPFSLSATVNGDPTPGARPMVLGPVTMGPEGQHIASGVQTQPTTRLRYGEQSTYVRTFSLPASGCADLTWAYPDESTESVLAIWAPAVEGGVASSFDPPVAFDDFSEFPVGGPRRFCASGLPGGRYMAGFLLLATDGSDDEPAGDPYTLKVVYPTGQTTIVSPKTSTDVSTTPAFPVSWAASQAASFDIDYTYRQRNAAGTYSIGAWRRWQSFYGITNEMFGVSAPKSIPGVTYFLRARAVGPNGVAGPWSTFKQTTVPLDDRYGYIKYSRDWSRTAGAGRYQGTLTEAALAGRFLTFDADTAGFTVIGDRCPTCGQLRVFVDGRLTALIDTYSKTVKTRQQLHYTGAFPTIGRHSLRVEVVGTKGRPRIALDGIAIIR